MLRVAFIDHTAKLSGGEIALLRLIPAIPDIEPIVILGEEGPLADELRQLSIQVHILQLGSLGDIKKDAVGGVRSGAASAGRAVDYVWRLTRLLLSLRVEIVHTNSLKAGFLGCTAARLAGIPSVWHLRDRLSDDYLPARAVTLTRFAIKVLPDAFIANSTATARTVRGSAEELVIPSPVVYDPHEHTVTGARAQDGASAAIGLIGRLAPWKGQDLFLRAFAAAFPAPSTHRAVIIGSAMFGEDAYADQLIDLSETLNIADRVEMRGFRRDVSSELDRLDVLVHASVIPEPFGQVVVEGMAAGVPVIAADTGGPAEIVSDGVDGLLYEMGSAPALADSLRAVVSDGLLRDKLIAGGLDRAKDFSPSVAGRAVRNVYAGIIQDREQQSGLRRRLGGSRRRSGDPHTQRQTK